MIKYWLCGIDSILGKVATVLTFGAQECWCCTFWRGVLVGIVFAVLCSVLY